MAKNVTSIKELNLEGKLRKTEQILNNNVHTHIKYEVMYSFTIVKYGIIIQIEQLDKVKGGSKYKRFISV